VQGHGKFKYILTLYIISTGSENSKHFKK